MYDNLPQGKYEYIQPKFIRVYFISVGFDFMDEECWTFSMPFRVVTSSILECYRTNDDGDREVVYCHEVKMEGKRYAVIASEWQDYINGPRLIIHE
jgi:hypothetical protein